MASVVGSSDDPGIAGVTGESSAFNGVLGVTTADGHSGVAGVCDIGGGAGVYGRSKRANGVIGFSSADGHAGVAGANDEGTGNGVYGRSARGDGVIGITNADGKAGVAGVCDTAKGNGVYGRSTQGNGVIGFSSSDGSAGVAGANHDGVGNGVYGRSAKSDGVLGVTAADGKAGVAGICETGKGNGVYGRSESGLAGLFDGNLQVTGNIDVLGDIRLINADCAEDFCIGVPEAVEPGTVMVLGDDGQVVPSNRPYDKRVAGVVSGGGRYKPAIVLDRHREDRSRQPIALLGKASCKVDADCGAIEIGDLLTTSYRIGHAMKAADPSKAFGAVIGKALQQIRSGTGVISILVALQ